MKTRAAVAFAPKQPLEIVEVDLDGPKQGEVLVEIMATGICHTDAYTLDGFDSEGIFPSILGHEGAGVVREVGPGVLAFEEVGAGVAKLDPDLVRPQVGPFNERFQQDHREDSFRCWLFTIARNLVSNRRRDRVRHPVTSLAGADLLSDDRPTPEEAAVATDDHRILLSLLDQLAPVQRDLLELRLIGLNDKEIAQVLNRSHDAIRKEQSRTIRALRDLVAQNPEWGGSHV